MAANLPHRNKKFETKKCPECMTYVAADAKECFSCGARLKEPDNVGIAKRPFNWKAYLFSLLSAVAFGLYIWWAFF